MSSLGMAQQSLSHPYAEWQGMPSTGLDYLYHRHVARHFAAWRNKQRRSALLVEEIVATHKTYSVLSDTELRQQANELRRELRSQGLSDHFLVHGFALLREVSTRTTGMRHFRSQLLAGLVMLDGAIAEMETGEGKTLAVTLPAALVAMAGVPVHVITVNDYLAHRDRQLMKPIYEFLGLSVGEIISTTTAEQRRYSYRCDITYCSNNEVVFDYLRDRLILGDRCGPAHLQFENLYGKRSRLENLFLGGLRFAIVDEADSVLVDETRTPLILSAQGKDEGRADVVLQALDVQESLNMGLHFTIDRLAFRVELTETGKASIAAMTSELGGVWASTRLSEQLVKQAIAATYLYLRDQHYIVRDDKVVIVDQHTGRVAPGRTWSGGMHQFIEAKEGCPVTPDPTTLARISYQSFFRRYIALSGMTGTAREVSDELWNVYGLRVTTVKPRIRSKRKFLGQRTMKTLGAKWDALIDAVTAAHEQGIPVLVGTSSVATSEQVSRMLDEACLTHAVLNARQDHNEADIIAQAGKSGRITVATNMAGRGTDIKIDEAAAKAGGLRVILTEYHDAARIDRQLIGRCARQGDPGSYLVIASLEDPIIMDGSSVLATTLARVARRCPAAVAQIAGRGILRLAQRSVEGKYSRMRQQLLRADESLNSRLAFAGRAE